jgi:hypothetical protein
MSTEIDRFSRLLWTAEHVPNRAARVGRLRASATPAGVGKSVVIGTPRTGRPSLARGKGVARATHAAPGGRASR